MVSTGLAVVLGMLAMVQGCDEAREVGWLWRVLLGARGKALGGGNGALFRSSAEGATDVRLAVSGSTVSVLRVLSSSSVPAWAYLHGRAGVQKRMGVHNASEA